jgi:hypothetical protein
VNAIQPIWADAATMAKMLCISPDTFRDHVRRGRLPGGVLLGGKRLWKVADVDKALEQMKPQGSNASLDEIDKAIDGGGHGAKKGSGRHAA